MAYNSEIRKLQTELRRLDSRIVELEQTIEKLNKKIERITVADDGRDSVALISETLGSIALLASGVVLLALGGPNIPMVAIAGWGALATVYNVEQSYLTYQEFTGKEDVKTYSTELNECYRLKTIVQIKLESKLRDKRK